MWQYIEKDEDGDSKEGAPKLPPGGTVYWAFDALRWCVVLGYTEPGGYSSFLSPNVSDDCNIIAFAPFGKIGPPDQERLKAAWPRGGAPGYVGSEVPVFWTTGGGS